jgi:hypothetical protein
MKGLLGLLHVHPVMLQWKSSALTVWEGTTFVGTVALNHTSAHHFIGWPAGLDHTLPQYHCIHWAF